MTHLKDSSTKGRYGSQLKLRSSVQRFRPRPFWIIRVIALCLAFGSILIYLPRQSARAAVDWPSSSARWTIRIIKVAGLEMEDRRWMHLHHGHATATEASNVRLGVEIIGSNNYETLDPSQSGIEVRYTVHNVPVSGWLAPPFIFVLNINNPALGSLSDGFHDISFEARGAARNNFKPQPAFLHLTRHGAISPVVPIIAGDDGGAGPPPDGSGVLYVNAADRRFRGYPVSPTVGAWHNPPYSEDLYLELMAPHSELFTSVQMWWEDPPHPGVPFVRGFPPKHGEDHRGLRVGEKHERFPFKDGPRGVGWMSPYVTGQVDSRGRFAFAEVGGRVGWLLPNGEVITVAGWRVRPDKDPHWYLKSLEVVRQNMELRGQWSQGRYAGETGGFRTPLDVAVDPTNENVLYVVGYEDHCIWRVEIIDARTNQVNVTVFAGDPRHSAGYRNGRGHAARFNGPASCVWDPVSDALYVADQNNDTIRKVARDGTVTTVSGSPGMAGRLRARGVEDVFNQPASRAASRFTVTAAEAQSGIRPDIYRPQSIRVDSHGNIILLELGYGSIRRLNPATGETKKMGDVWQKFGEWDRGWAWLDVDRWGNTGPRDGIYWCKFVGSDVDGEAGERFNEVYAWLPPGGGLSRFIFGDDWEPHPDGWGLRSNTDPPHYPWLVAVDPRGALLIAGGGEHGLSRLRKRRSNDPVPAEYYPSYYSGQLLWASGGELASRSSTFKFGWGAHNYLGFADAWGLTGNETDAQLLDTFEAPGAIRNDVEARSQWLYFLRHNIGPPAASPPDRTAPTAPARLTANGATSASLNLTWAASTDNVGVARYRLDVATNSSFTTFVPGYQNKAVGNILRYTVTGLAPSTTYYARVRAQDAAGNTSRNSPSATGTTTNPPLPVLSINDISVTEGDAGTKNAMFTVTLSPASSQRVTVRFATANGTALAGQDYVALSGTLVFNPGQTTRAITAAIKGEALNEPNESLFVNLTNPINATIRDARGVCSITNDD
jgi:Calx-beta domain/Fibronectin type III domain